MSPESSYLNTRMAPDSMYAVHVHIVLIIQISQFARKNSIFYSKSNICSDLFILCLCTLLGLLQCTSIYHSICMYNTPMCLKAGVHVFRMTLTSTF